jgi:hypothetical protein
MSSETWSRVRKLIVILLLGGMLTVGFIWIAERDSEQASRAILPYSASMAVLGMAYVSETVLRIVAERLPLPAALAGKRDDD